MAAAEVEEVIALALVFAVHVVGGLLLVWALLDSDRRGNRRRGRGEDGGGGGGGGGGPRDPGGPPAGGDETRWSPLLPDAAPSRMRLRAPGRVGDDYRTPPRRPEHEPRPVREPAQPSRRQTS